MPAKFPLRLRATPALRQLIAHQTPRTRPFSILSKARQLARSTEAHPFERYPVSQRAQRGDWGKLARHVGDSALLYVFSFFLFKFL